MRIPRPIVYALSTVAFVALVITAPQLLAEKRLVFEKKSEFNHVFVYDQDGYRSLAFEDGATQSEINLSKPDQLVLAYTRAIMSAFAVVHEPRRIMIVGLGGAAMPNFIRRVYPEVQMDIAELDPVVVDVAKRYFNFKVDAGTKVYVGDGRKFIETTAERYDIIFLDAYGADSIPYSLATREFLQAVKAKLTDNGIAVSNVWSSESNKLYGSMIKTYRDVFPELHVIRAQASLNRIFIAPGRKMDLTPRQLAANAAALKQRSVRRLNLDALIERGYDAEPNVPESAKVLLDADAPKD